MTPSGNPYYREPFTVGHLLSLLHDSESFRAGNRRLAEQGLMVGSAEDATFRDNCAHLQRIDAALARAPGFDRLKPHFAALGERPTATVLRKLAGKVCIEKGLEWRAVLDLDLDAFAELLQAPAEPPTSDKATGATDRPVMARLLAFYTNNVAEEKFHELADVLESDLTANEKLERIDALIPIRADATSRQLAELLGTTHQTIQKTAWWRTHRRGAQDRETAEREARLRERGRLYESPPNDD